MPLLSRHLQSNGHTGRDGWQAVIPANAPITIRTMSSHLAPAYSQETIKQIYLKTLKKSKSCIIIKFSSISIVDNFYELSNNAALINMFRVYSWIIKFLRLCKMHEIIKLRKNTYLTRIYKGRKVNLHIKTRGLDLSM